jgi:hypothetical protein
VTIHSKNPFLPVTNALHFDNTTDVIIGVDHTEPLGEETSMLGKLRFPIEPENDDVRRLHIVDLYWKKKLIHDICHRSVCLSGIALFIVSVVEAELFAHKNENTTAVDAQSATTAMSKWHSFSDKRASVLDDRFLGPKKLKTRLRHPES